MWHEPQSMWREPGPIGPGPHPMGLVQGPIGAPHWCEGGGRLIHPGEGCFLIHH